MSERGASAELTTEVSSQTFLCVAAGACIGRMGEVLKLSKCLRAIGTLSVVHFSGGGRGKRGEEQMEELVSQQPGLEAQEVA